MCRAEGPGVEQFARQHADKLLVVGLGAQDNYEYALEFVDTTGTTSFPMVWDPEFTSWRHFDVFGQPQVRLLDRNGALVAAWSGAIPEDDVLEMIAEL